MCGRIEMDRKNEEWINEKLKNSPEYLCNYIKSEKKKTSTTRKAYLGYLLRFIEYIQKKEINIYNVKPKDIDDYIETECKGNGASIINLKISAIMSLYNYFLKNDLIVKNPCSSDMKYTIQDKEIVYMTDDEKQSLKENINMAHNRKSKKYISRDYAIVQLGCSTGLRVSAIVNIDIDDIDFEKKTIDVIEKGNKKRTIVIGDNTIKALKDWMMERNKILNGADVNALFINPQHNRLRRESVARMIRTETSNFNKHITPHKMRSTCAMDLYKAKHDIVLVQKQLGHKNIQNTKKYADATEEMLREAANILD